MDELREKIIEAGRELQLMNVATITGEGKPWVRYVMGKLDKDLSVRFCTRLDSRKVAQIHRRPDVHISFGVADLQTARHWVQVQGTAEASVDRTERHTFWFDALSNYFSGPDDPNYCVVIVTPSRIEFGTMGNTTPAVWEQEK